MKDKYKKIVDATILFLTDCGSMEEALEYFEVQRKKHFLPRNRALFEEISIAQIAILFKLKIDNGDLILKGNKIKLRK